MTGLMLEQERWCVHASCKHFTTSSPAACSLIPASHGINGRLNYQVHEYNKQSFVKSAFYDFASRTRILQGYDLSILLS